MRRIWTGLSWLLLFPTVAGAQGRGLTGACNAADPALLSTCLVAAQAAESMQAQIGLLIAGGNPTTGTASTGGLRLGFLPGVSATVRANLVSVRFPDLREIRTTPTDGLEYGELSIVAPSLSGTATLALRPGVSLGPTIRGIGSIDLLATASWLPLRTFGGEEFRASSAELAWGAGVRVGLLRESFTLPGAAISLVYHRLGTVGWGRSCPVRVASTTTTGPGYSLERAECVPPDIAGADRGDLGEFELDLSSWSTRVVVSKHLLNLGLSAGVGYDRFSSDVAVAVQQPRGPFGDVIAGRPFAGIRDVDLSQGRWSAFVGGTYSVLLATLATELGWMQGGDAVSGYPGSINDFDPGDGTLFGSVGVRVAL